MENWGFTVADQRIHIYELFGIYLGTTEDYYNKPWNLLKFDYLIT